MQEKRLRIAVIYGSTREGRLCDRIVRWAVGEIERQDRYAIDIIDPLDLALPARHGGHSEGLFDLWRRLDTADAFLIVTPEYNHSFTAPLKQLIDSGKDQWRAKPVAFVSYGGISGGLRAVEQLRLVFAELHAVTIRDVVSFANPWGRFNPSGGLSDGVGEAAKMAHLLAHLDWWGSVLRDARARAPYDEIAA